MPIQPRRSRQGTAGLWRRLQRGGLGGSYTVSPCVSLAKASVVAAAFLATLDWSVRGCVRADACQFGADAIVRELLQSGARLVTDKSGMTGRDYAVKHEHHGIVDMIDSAAALFSGAPLRRKTALSALHAEQRERDHRAKLETRRECAIDSTAADDHAATAHVTRESDHALPDNAWSANKKMEESPVGNPSSLVSTDARYERVVQKAAAVAAAADAAHKAISEARAQAAAAGAAPPCSVLLEASLEEASPSALSRVYPAENYEAEDPNDPMATIRRLAQQYRSKHFHHQLAARQHANQIDIQQEGETAEH